MKVKLASNSWATMRWSCPSSSGRKQFSDDAERQSASCLEPKIHAGEQSLEIVLPVPDHNRLLAGPSLPKRFSIRPVRAIRHTSLTLLPVLPVAAGTS